MRYEKGHKDETRQHIIDVAAKRFREDGIAAAGVAGLMADAGLTNGAFYTHFDSKEHLVREAILSAFERKDGLRALAERGASLEVWIRKYLSARHRNNPGVGCLTAALVAEVARHPGTTRDAFTGKLTGVIELIADLLPAGAADERRRIATALFGLMVGTLQLARAVSDDSLADEILENGIMGALALAGLGETSGRVGRDRVV